MSLSQEIKDVTTNHLYLLCPRISRMPAGLSLGKTICITKKKVTLQKDLLLGSLKLELLYFL